jgi:hypothetical protein
MSSPKKTPISIYVTGRTGVQPLPEEEEELRLQELMPAVLESDRILKQVASTFVEQYGDELKEWPTEAQAQYDEAKKAWAVANAAAGEVKWFGDNTQKDVDDSVKDLKK